MKESWFHRLFYQCFGFKWRHPFITLSKILYRGKSPKRVLGVWDFGNGRAVIGDAIGFQGILLCLAEKHGVEKIDVVFVTPPPDSRNLFQVTQAALIQQIISTSRLNPLLGSVFVFDSNEQFGCFFRRSSDDYLVFPDPRQPFATVSNWHHVTDFFDCFGRIPFLRSQAEDLAWAGSFIETHGGGRTVLTVNLRRNGRDEDRNAPILVWQEFFCEMSKRYPSLYFIVVGSAHEIFPELRVYGNVLFVKEIYPTTLLQDLALIESGTAHVGHHSGVSVFPWWVGKPCILFGGDMRHAHFGHAYMFGNGDRFLGPHQKAWNAPYQCIDMVNAFNELIVPVLPPIVIPELHRVS